MVYLKYVINYILDKIKLCLHKFLRLYKPMSSSARFWSTVSSKNSLHINICKTYVHFRIHCNRQLNAHKFKNLKTNFKTTKLNYWPRHSCWVVRGWRASWSWRSCSAARGRGICSTKPRAWTWLWWSLCSTFLHLTPVYLFNLSVKI